MKYLPTDAQFPSLFSDQRRLASPRLTVTYPRITSVEETACGSLPAIRLSLERPLRNEEEAEFRRLMTYWRQEKSPFSADIKAGRSEIVLHAVPKCPKPLAVLQRIAYLVMRETINNASGTIRQ